MAEPALSREIVEAFSDRVWRLEHLYKITDSYGAVVPFKLRPAQRKLVEDLHYLNIVLKARQEGFSTLILLIALDCCIFNDHFAAGLIADTKVNAENLLVRAKFAYASMPDEIQKLVPIVSDNSTMMQFANGSSIEVGVSLRSSTKNFLHISEYGKICAKQPDKATEIKSGSLNTLAARQLAFIESTAEGKGGDFFEKCKQARAIDDAGREPADMEWKFHFFAWWMEPRYSSEQPYTLAKEDVEYFAALEREHGVSLTIQQRWWYAAKRKEQGDDMLKEFPSTPDEAFSGAIDGAIWGKTIRQLRQLKRIGGFPYVPGLPVNTFWDFGLGDMQTIWLHQEVAGLNRFVGYYENNNVGLGHYFEHLTKWRELRSAIWGKHYGPHDIEHQRQGIEAKSIARMSKEAGWPFVTVQRTPDKRIAIEGARQQLITCQFDETECARGIEHLEAYSWVWDANNGVWMKEPRHDAHSHGADAFMTFTDGYKPAKVVSGETAEPRASFWSM